MDEALRTIELKSDIRELATRFSVLTWMVGINVALGLGVLGKLLR